MQLLLFVLEEKIVKSIWGYASTIVKTEELAFHQMEWSNVTVPGLTSDSLVAKLVSLKSLWG